jgi:membrane protein insertase Oxa1/YidC/SpoIIIJ
MHWLVEAAQHVISPLTASLFIFGVHKVSQAPAMRTFLRAAWTLAKAKARNWRSAAAAGESRHTKASWAAPLTIMAAVPTPEITEAVVKLGPAVSGASIAEGVAAANVVPPRTEFDAGSEALLSDAQRDLMTRLAELYAPEHIPTVAAHVIEFWSVQRVEELLHAVHNMGIPWWGTIVGTTLLLRVGLAFIQVGLLRNSLRMTKITPAMEVLDDALTRAATEEEREKCAKDVMNLLKENKCHPFKHFVTFPLLLPPTILSIFAAIHNTSLAEPTMANEGMLWFPDLVGHDPTYLLPTISALTWLWNVELGAGVHYHAWQNPRVAARAIAVASIQLTSTLPAGVLLFWVTSNMFAVARTFVVRGDSMRRLLNIPLREEMANLPHVAAVKPQN